MAKNNNKESCIAARCPFNTNGRCDIGSMLGWASCWMDRRLEGSMTVRGGVTVEQLKEDVELYQQLTNSVNNDSDGSRRSH